MTTQKLPCGASPDCLHLTCEHCSVLIRTSRSKAGDHPGTRAGKLKTGQCGPCERRGGPPPKGRPDECVECNKPFRELTETIRDRPGTVHHRAQGLCLNCHRRKNINERRAYERKTERLRSMKKRESRANTMTDERNILLSDDEMLHIMANHPRQFYWHVARRRRLKLGEYS